MAAKLLQPALAGMPIKGGRCAFVTVGRMDGRLGFGGGHKSERADVVTFAERGAHFGLCKSLDLEWPDVFCRGVDVDPAVGADKAAKLVLAELADPDMTVRETGHTADGARWTSTASPLVPTAEPGKPVTKDDVWVVTGGARGITPLCVAEMARLAHGGTYLLLGRSKLHAEPAWAKGLSGKALDDAAMAFVKSEFAAGRGDKPTPKLVKAALGGVEATREVNESMLLIKQAGGTVEYHSGDVADPAAVVRALAGRRITGVFHASGVLRDKMIQNKTAEDFSAVYDTKVAGLRALLKACDPAQLSHLVVFSSLAGFHGNRGQTDYACANEVLNKTVHAIRARFPNCRARAFDFGPWSGGMVTPALQKMFEEQGVEIIPRVGGAQTVANVVFHTEPAQALFGNWGLPPVSPPSGSVSITRVVSFKKTDNTCLDAHVIKGKRVVPFTLMTQTLAQMALGVHPGWHLHSILDVQLFRGLVESDVADTIVLTIALVDERASDAEVRVHCDAKMTDSHGRASPCYKCVVVLGVKPRPPFTVPSLAQAIAKPAAPQGALSGGALYDGRTLFHGPAFQVIDDVLSLNGDQVVARLHRVAVDPRDQGQFAVSPNSFDGFTADALFQLPLVWARQTVYSGSLPNFAKAFDYFRDLPVGAEAFAVMVKDDQGEVVKGSATVWKSQIYVCDANGGLYLSARVSTVLHKDLTW